MTVWHFFAAYSVTGVGVFLLGLIGQVISAFGRPANSNGHLDVRLNFSKGMRWFLLSAILVLPMVVAYSEEVSNGYRYERLERSNFLTKCYLFFLAAWIMKLQLELKKLKANSV